MKPISITNLSSHTLSGDRFVKKIRNYNSPEQQNSLLYLHQDNTLSIPSSNTIAQFQTILYDAANIFGNILVSSKDMPIRLYKNVENRLEFINSIGLKRKNSEIYLSPIQLIHKDQIIIGGGKKFLHEYDLNKLTIKKQYKQMNKKHISTLQLSNCRKIVLVGQFDGTIEIIEINNDQNINKLKIHMDSITSIITHPTNPYYFITSARKDDFRYLWDVRMLDNFVNSYREPLYGNQRVGIDFSTNGQYIYGGNQLGHVIVWETDSSDRIGSIKMEELIQNQQNLQYPCIGAVSCIDKNKFIVAIGGRNYSLQSSKKPQNAYILTIECILVD